MGSELRRKLRVALGPGITGLQRAVALEIADDARYDDNWRYDPDKGRRSKVRLAELVEWTGAKDANVVRNAIKRLSAAGWEFRIPIGQDKHGKPMYAVPGRAMTFRVPDFEGVATATPMPEGGALATPRESQGSPYGELGLPIGGVGATPPSPSSLGSLTNSPSSAALPPAGDESASQGGGGGDPSFEDQAAEALAASLDYRGTAPRAGQVATIRRRAAAALCAGWTEQELKEYLDLKGDPNVRDAAALYGHRLQPDQLPDPVAFREAARRPLEGTDAIVSGWMDLARPKAPHRPYQDSWGRLEEEGRNGSRPQGWEKVPHCGDPDCDEVTRRRDQIGHDGLPTATLCQRCHPAMRF
ncbi:hypothetical protein [Streptomyces sp. NPDC058629]|uniref:hypothetical protein n=1 Tax=Streptomyces sp. NPDC058629 TaxID=3346565 RepID=UPI0036514775